MAFQPVGRSPGEHSFITKLAQEILAYDFDKTDFTNAPDEAHTVLVDKIAGSGKLFPQYLGKYTTPLNARLMSNAILEM